MKLVAGSWNSIVGLTAAVAGTLVALRLPDYWMMAPGPIAAAGFCSAACILAALYGFQRRVGGLIVISCLMLFLYGATLSVAIQQVNQVWLKLAAVFVGISVLVLGLGRAFPPWSGAVWWTALVGSVVLIFFILWRSRGGSNPGLAIGCLTIGMVASITGALWPGIRLSWGAVACWFAAGSFVLWPAGAALLNRPGPPDAGVLAAVCMVVMPAATLLDSYLLERMLRSNPHRELDEAMRDQLTKLANRRAIDVYGPQLTQMSYAGGRAVTVLMADLDHFKQINDLYGHAVGDEALKLVASTLGRQVRSSDLVARYGGEEFLVVLPGSALAPAIRIGEKIRKAIENSQFESGGKAIPLTISIGVATGFAEDSPQFQALVERADANLYNAKRRGRNRVAVDEIPAFLS